jgi:hypothetical protein
VKSDMVSRLVLITCVLALAACNSKVADQPQKKLTPKAHTSAGVIPKQQGEQLGTPMAERVATIALLNKRNGQTQDFELKPGQDIRVGKVVIRLRACERTAPWEKIPDQGAFVQLLAFERPPGTTDKERWRQIFSGWLFKENPAANVVEHPVYDVWVKQCKMSFPGEEDIVQDALPSLNSEDGAEVGAAPVAKPETVKAPTVPKKPSREVQSAPRAAAAPAAEEADPGGEETILEDAVVEN